jgi:hypothetical protein
MIFYHISCVSSRVRKSILYIYIYIYICMYCVKEPIQSKILIIRWGLKILFILFSNIPSSSESSLKLKLARVYIVLCLIFIK